MPSTGNTETRGGKTRLREELSAGLVSKDSLKLWRSLAERRLVVSGRYCTRSQCVPLDSVQFLLWTHKTSNLDQNDLNLEIPFLANQDQVILLTFVPVFQSDIGLNHLDHDTNFQGYQIRITSALNGSSLHITLLAM